MDSGRSFTRNCRNQLPSLHCEIYFLSLSSFFCCVFSTSLTGHSFLWCCFPRDSRAPSCCWALGFKLLLFNTVCDVCLCMSVWEFFFSPAHVVTAACFPVRLERMQPRDKEAVNTCAFSSHTFLHTAVLSLSLSPFALLSALPLSHLYQSEYFSLVGQANPLSSPPPHTDCHSCTQACFLLCFIIVLFWLDFSMSYDHTTLSFHFHFILPLPVTSALSIRPVLLLQHFYFYVSPLVFIMRWMFHPVLVTERCCL